MSQKHKPSFVAAVAVAFAATFFLSGTPAGAQAAYNSQGATGQFGRSSATTNNLSRGLSAITGNQAGLMRQAGLGGLSPISGPTGRNGLPVCSMDSFVLNAGGHAEHIYGDEGPDGLPPYFEFTKVHRINTGITGARDQGLTTNHGSYLPDAWGGDEWVDGPEFDKSGHNGNANTWSYMGSQGTQNANSAGLNGNGSNLPPSPGPGYQAAYQHGSFVGYYSPSEVQMWQSDPAAALRSFVNSARYLGGAAGRNSILYEIGDILSPF